MLRSDGHVPRFRRYAAALVAHALLTTTCVTLNGCGERQTSSYESPEQIVGKFYNHERLIGKHGMLEWSLHEVLGPDGPYVVSSSMPIQSNPGQSVTFTVKGNADEIEKQYIPESDDQSFIGVPVVNANGQHALIVCRTIPESEATGETRENGEN